jgi:hypothetical protein
MLHDAWTTWPAAFGMMLPPHPGIVVLDAATHFVLARVLSELLADTPPAQFANAIFWWRRHAGWRQQPIAHASWEPYQGAVNAERE